MDPSVFVLNPSKVPDTFVDNFLRGIIARELIFPRVNYKNWVQARLRPFPTFIRNDDIEGWKVPERNIKFVHGFDNLIDETVPFAKEAEEDVPYIPKNDEMVPRTTVNKVINVLNAFRTAYKKTKHAFACQSVTMARDDVPRYGVHMTHRAFCPPRPWDDNIRRPLFAGGPTSEQQTRPPIP